MGPKKDRDNLYYRPHAVYCLQSHIGCNVNRQQIEAAVQEVSGRGTIIDVVRVKKALWVIYLSNEKAVNSLLESKITINDQKVKMFRGNYNEAKKACLNGAHPEIKDNPFSDSDDDGK